MFSKELLINMRTNLWKTLVTQSSILSNDPFRKFYILISM
jgi:hypothetical protein